MWYKTGYNKSTIKKKTGGKKNDEFKKYDNPGT